MTNPTTTPGSPTLQQKLTVVKYLAKGRDLEFIQTAVRELTEDKIRLIATSHGYPDVDKLKMAQAALERKIELEATHLPPSPHGDAIRDTRNANRVTGNASAAPATVTLTPPATPAQLTKPDEIRVLLNTAKQSSSKRIQRKADQIFDQVGQLRDLVKAEQDKADAKAAREAERQQALDEVRQLEEQLKSARAKLRGHKNHPGGNGRATVTASPSSESRRPGAAAAQGKTLDAGRAFQRDVLARHDTTAAGVRQWARDNSVECPERGARIPRAVLEAYDAAHTNQKGTNAA